VNLYATHERLNKINSVATFEKGKEAMLINADAN
jgi:hypothetical protein